MNPVLYIYVYINDQSSRFVRYAPAQLSLINRIHVVSITKKSTLVCFGLLKIKAVVSRTYAETSLHGLHIASRHGFRGFLMVTSSRP